VAEPPAAGRDRSDLVTRPNQVCHERMTPWPASGTQNLPRKQGSQKRVTTKQIVVRLQLNF
jgi:hypothetical protein